MTDNQTINRLYLKIVSEGYGDGEYGNDDRSWGYEHDERDAILHIGKIPELIVRKSIQLRKLIDQFEIWTAVGEILSDAGLYEANLRLATTPNAEMKKATSLLMCIFDYIKRQTGVGNNVLYQVFEEYLENDDGVEQEEDFDIEVIMPRYRHMLWSAIFGEDDDAAPRP